tara:strand:+ start:56 stop:301 length:246 start_codon:yes stop_codon:yes gene_type:complete
MELSPAEEKERRKYWNQTYYIKHRKDKVEMKEKAKDYYITNKETYKQKQTFYYYRRTNQLDKLNKKYPEIYNIFVNNIPKE